MDALLVLKAFRSPVISALFAGLFSALVAGIAAGWVVHKIDSAAYVALERDTAKAQAEARGKDIAALESFMDRQQKAGVAVTKQLAAGDKARAAQTDSLTQLLNEWSMKDATLAACLATKLPADVLRSLTR